MVHKQKFLVGVKCPLPSYCCGCQIYQPIPFPWQSSLEVETTSIRHYHHDLGIELWGVTQVIVFSWQPKLQHRYSKSVGRRWWTLTCFAGLQRLAILMLWSHRIPTKKQNWWYHLCWQNFHWYMLILIFGNIDWGISITIVAFFSGWAVAAITPWLRTSSEEQWFPRSKLISRTSGDVWRTAFGHKVGSALALAEGSWSPSQWPHHSRKKTRNDIYIYIFVYWLV